MLLKNFNTILCVDLFVICLSSWDQLDVYDMVHSTSPEEGYDESSYLVGYGGSGYGICIALFMKHRRGGVWWIFIHCFISFMAVFYLLNTIILFTYLWQCHLISNLTMNYCLSYVISSLLNRCQLGESTLVPMPLLFFVLKATLCRGFFCKISHWWMTQNRCGLDRTWEMGRGDPWGEARALRGGTKDPGPSQGVVGSEVPKD